MTNNEKEVQTVSPGLTSFQCCTKQSGTFWRMSEHLTRPHADECSPDAEDTSGPPPLGHDEG